MAAANVRPKLAYRSAYSGGRQLTIPGVKGATDGTLTIMYGSADPVASELAVPLLQHEARPGGVVHCGNSGSGVAVKVVNK